MSPLLRALRLAMVLPAATALAEVTRKCEVDKVVKDVTFVSGRELNAKLRARGRKATYEPTDLWVSLRMNTSLLTFRVVGATFENGDVTAETWRSFFIGEAKVKATNDDWGEIVIIARKGADWVDDEENARLGRKRR